jgi:hypothetical protein
VSKRTDELHSLRQLWLAVEHLLDGGADLGAEVAEAVASCRGSGKRRYSARSPIGANGGRGAVFKDFDLSVPSTRDTTPISPIEKNGIGAKSIGAKTRETWLSPYLAAYHTAYGAKATVVAIKRMAKTFSELEGEMDRAEVVRRFGHYCHGTPGRFYSVERFAETLPAWTESLPVKAAPGAVPTQLPGETGDDYAMRLARAGF